MSAAFELADTIVERSAVTDPVGATFSGVAGHDDRLTDYSPAAEDDRAAQVGGWLAHLDAVSLDGDDDRLAVAVMRERLAAQRSMHDARDHLRDINVLGSPMQSMQRVFDLMPIVDDGDWETVAARMEGVPAAMASLQRTYEAGIAEALVPARRQVLGAARVAAVVAGAEGEGGTPSAPWFEGFAGRYSGADLALKSRLEAAAGTASATFGQFSNWLRSVYAPAASETDAVGEERYRRMARVYTGADLDLRETYAWGWADLQRITALMNECASKLYGGVTPVQAQHLLDADPEHTIEGAEQARDWLQRITDETVASFDGRYFDIPEPMRVCQAMLAPPGSAAAPYYTSPSEDFSRPGRTWLPVSGQDRFATWWLTSTWYHEAVPGHHLQIGYAVLQRERLSRFQRLEVVSGHVEGWALYAERLMDELGYFDSPATELGFLSGQALRASRIVVDIGLHLDLSIPDDLDPALFEGTPDARGGRWDPDLARSFLAARALLPEYFAASEVDRYLGLPGQAISYKVGERVWLAAREEAASEPGFDLKDWHMRALSLGSVGLDVLREELRTRGAEPG